MAQLQQPFNAQAIDPTQGGSFNQLPVGTHPVVIVASEVKANAANTGGMVVFELQVIDGPSKGASGTWRINLYSASDKARAIAESTFSALCYAVNEFMVTHTEVLHGKPFAVVVGEQGLTDEQKVKQANGEKVTPFTEVKRVLNADGSEIKGGGQAQAPAPAPQQQYAAPAQAPAAQQAWGGGQQAAQAPAQGWGGQPQGQAPAPAPAPAAGGWQQGAAAGGKPSWGKQ